MQTLPNRWSITLVGAGPVGLTLAALLRRSGHRVTAVISRSPSSARRGARALGVRIASSSLAHIPRQTDLLLIAVPDEQIRIVADEIARSSQVSWHSVAAFHCSGIESSDLLESLAAKGVRTFALHPVQSFPARRILSDQLALMSGVSYGFEGPRRQLRIGRKIVKDLGGRMIMIPKQKKILYHVACVFASNYPVVLLDIVEELAKAVSPRFGLEAFRPLTESSIAHAMRLSPARGLTGPVARGSRSTVRRHLQGLTAASPRMGELYRSLALAALHLAARQGRARQKDLSAIKTMLRRRS